MESQQWVTKLYTCQGNTGRTKISPNKKINIKMCCAPQLERKATPEANVRGHFESRQQGWRNATHNTQKGKGVRRTKRTLGSYKLHEFWYSLLSQCLPRESYKMQQALPYQPNTLNLWRCKLLKLLTNYKPVKTKSDSSHRATFSQTSRLSSWKMIRSY